jgi:hydroxypyruvate reductase/glycerate 2-kinase
MYLDRSSFADARGILQARGIWQEIPEAVRGVVESGCTGRIPESPKAAAKHIRHFLIGSNGIALQAAVERAEALGYDAVVARQMISGDADTTGQELVALARSVVRTDRSRCYCFGGETTVLVTGDGRGGRNQQLCLSALSVMRPNDDFTLLSAGTDGIDGNSDAAGAVIDPATCDRVLELDLNIREALQRNDATGFFEQSGNLIVTGPSGTNVMDVVILIIPGKTA